MTCKGCGHEISMNQICERPIQAATDMLKHMAVHNASRAFAVATNVMETNRSPSSLPPPPFRPSHYPSLVEPNIPPDPYLLRCLLMAFVIWNMSNRAFQRLASAFHRL
jgi:hypothetical protein